MFNVLDTYKKGGSSGSAARSNDGRSVRNLIGQVQLRHIVDDELAEMIQANNRIAMKDDKYQFVILPTGKKPPAKYQSGVEKIPLDKLTPLQATNLRMNIELIEMENQITEREGVKADAPDVEFT
jgi:hypothetical protein